MAKIAITGANGFVGKNLAPYLMSGHELFPVSRQSLTARSVVLDGIDAVVHLAGKAHDLKKVAEPDEYFEVNYELTKSLYDQFLSSKATKFIYISSVKAAADSVTGPLTEDFPPDPKTFYGKSKLMAERYIESQMLPAGKSYYILRPCMIHGPGNKGNLNLLYNLVSKGIPYPLASFDNSRSYLSVENLCFVIREIIERGDIPGGVYHLADDEVLSTNDLIKLLSQSLGKRPRLLNIPRSFVNIVAQAGDMLHLPLTTERLHKLTENYIVSNQKIKLTLKKDLPLSAREGILKTGLAFKNA